MSLEWVKGLVVAVGVLAGVSLVYTSIVQYEGGWWLLGTSSLLTGLLAFSVALWVYRGGN